MKKIKLSFSIFLLCFFACSKSDVFFEFRSTENGSWDRSKPAIFEINISDTIKSYSLDLIVRNNDDYAFQNIWLFIDRKDPKGIFTSDSLTIELADAYGKWHGKGLSIYSLTIPYQSDVLFSDSGCYTYTIRQGMRKNPLRGISDIGLRLSKNSAQ